MSEAVRLMSLDEFDAWQLRQEQRFELVAGRVFAMTGATFAHDLIVSNLMAALSAALRTSGKGCKPFTADIGVVTGPNTLRRPDVSVFCPPFERRSARSDKPVLVAEVFSPSTKGVDQVAKLLEYRALPSLETVLLLTPDRIDVGMWQRDGGDWRFTLLRDDPAGTLEIAGLGITLSAADIYDGAAIAAVSGPRVVWPEDLASGGR